MTRVMLFSDSPEVARKVRIAAEDELTVLRPEQLPAGPAQTLALVPDSSVVRVLVLDTNGGGVPESTALDLASRFEETFPSVSTVLVSGRPDEVGLAALRAGVRDVVTPEASVEDLRWTLRRAEDTGANFSDGAEAATSGLVGRVITVASPKGGVGKTTVATNLAVGLAQDYPQGTVLVDLDAQFGDVAAGLDLDPVYTIADVLSGPAAQDPIALKSLLTLHQSGLYVVPGVRTPAEAEAVTADKVGRLLRLLKQEFRFVVLDTSPGLSDITLAGLDHTTDLVVVAGLDVPSIRGLRKVLELLDEIHLEPSTRHVVINMADKAGGLSVADVEATIGRDVDLVIPRADAFARATNQGVPLVLGQPRNAGSRDLMKLITRFSPSATQPRLFGGRHRGRAVT